MKKGQVQCPLDGPLVAADVQRMSVGLVLKFCVGHVSLKLVLAQLPPFLTAFSSPHRSALSARTGRLASILQAMIPILTS